MTPTEQHDTEPTDAQFAEAVEAANSPGAKRIAELERENAELRADLVSAQFWRAHAERTNTELEQDYLAIWKAAKEPDKTVLDSVLGLRKEVVALRKWKKDREEAERATMDF